MKTNKFKPPLLISRTPLKHASLQIRMPHELLEDLTTEAEHQKIYRQELVRQLLRFGLNYLKGKAEFKKDNGQK